MDCQQSLFTATVVNVRPSTVSKQVSIPVASVKSQPTMTANTSHIKAAIPTSKMSNVQMSMGSSMPRASMGSSNYMKMGSSMSSRVPAGNVSMMASTSSSNFGMGASNKYVTGMSAMNTTTNSRVTRSNVPTMFAGGARQPTFTIAQTATTPVYGGYLNR